MNSHTHMISPSPLTWKGRLERFLILVPCMVKLRLTSVSRVALPTSSLTTVA